MGKMMKKFLVFLMLINGLAYAEVESAEADRKTWGGFWWSMRNGELVLGWKGQHGRRKWTPKHIELFDSCLTLKSAYCENVLKEFSQNKGRALSPMMKFDLYMKRYVETYYGKEAPLFYYSHAALKELEIHYIGNNINHRHYSSQNFAGKCIGWALSTFDYNEPTEIKTIFNIDFTPADIKGFLAAIYNGAQFFVPDYLISGQEYRNQGRSSSAFKDVHPKDFIWSLRETIGRGTFLEADLDPGRGVWNYPIHKYDVKWERKEATVVRAEITIEFANDEVKIDDVFSNQSYRKDMKHRTYYAEFKVPRNWDGDLLSATSGHWTGKSITNHPDAVILGIEEGWREEILDYADTDMALEVNYELIKSHDGFESVIDGLIESYFE